jgi:hypothetical protein
MEHRRPALAFVVVPCLLMFACASRPVATPASSALPPPAAAVAYEASLTGL